MNHENGNHENGNHENGNHENGNHENGRTLPKPDDCTTDLAHAAPDFSILDAEPGAADQRALEALADERVVHGLLRVLAPGEAAAIERRVVEAVIAIPIDGSISKPRARVAPAQVAPARVIPARVIQGRTARHRAWLASMVPALALVVISLFLARIATTTTPVAIADLPSVLEGMNKAGPRRYSVSIERDGTGPGAMREGTVDIGPGGRFVARLGLPNRAPAQISGFDGERYWIVPPQGPVWISRSRELLARRGELRDSTEMLIVGRLLRKLESGYDVSIDPVRQEDGTLRFTARRNPEISGRRGEPTLVVFEARENDRVVMRLEATWTFKAPTPAPALADESPRLPGLAGRRPKRLAFTLLESPAPSGAWFRPETHIDPDRAFVTE